MVRFVLRRLAVAIPLLFIVATISFFLLQLVPGSPAAAILGPTATLDQVATLNHQLGLDRPLLAQFLQWIGHALTGNLGDSYTTGQTVASTLGESLPPTLSLALLSTLVTLVAGLFLGMAAAVRGGRTDRAVQWVASLGMAVPNFWLAAMLVFLFAIKLAVFPATGYAEISTDGIGAWISHLILPILALSAANLGQITFQARAAFRDSLSRDYVRTLHATGVPRRLILFKHVLRNAAVPVATVTGLTFIFTLGGVVVLELIFTLPGMGNLMLTSVQTHDFSVVLGGVVYFSIVVVLVNLVVDIVTAGLDPRARLR